jgi:hypothetical protein
VEANSAEFAEIEQGQTDPEIIQVPDPEPEPVEVRPDMTLGELVPEPEGAQKPIPFTGDWNGPAPDAEGAGPELTALAGAPEGDAEPTFEQAFEMDRESFNEMAIANGLDPDRLLEAEGFLQAVGNGFRGPENIRTFMKAMKADLNDIEWKAKVDAGLERFGMVAEDPQVVAAQRLERIEQALLEDRQARAEMQEQLEMDQRAELEVGATLQAVMKATGRLPDMQAIGPQMIELLSKGTAPDVAAEVLVGRIRASAPLQSRTVSRRVLENGTEIEGLGTPRVRAIIPQAPTPAQRSALEALMEDE